MVPKESGFNQSVAASGMCARKASHFPCSPAVARDGEVIQRQHFCHHGDTLPSKGRLRNNQTVRNVYTWMRSFQTELFSHFLPSSYAGHVNLTASKHWRFMPKCRYIDRFQTTLSLTPGASTRARKHSSAQDATKFNGAIQPIIYRCHEFSLQRIDLAITSGSSHWPISSSRRSRKAHVIAVKVYRDPAGQTEVFVPVSLLQTFN